jgi:hypothetical protein
MPRTRCGRPLDAEKAAHRALAAPDTAVPKDTATIVESLRALRIARDGAIKARTAALNQLKDLITTDQLRSGVRRKTLRAVAAEAARIEFREQISLRSRGGRLTRRPTHMTKIQHHRSAADLFAGWWQVIERLGAVRGCWSGPVRARSAAGALVGSNSSVRRS